MLTDMQSTLEIAEGAADNDPDIATRLGVTKQTVHRKHGHRTGRR